MNWQDFLGHEQVIERFKRSLSNGRLASSFLFIGQSGIGKRTFAILLAKSLLCENGDGKSLEACGQCSSCIQVDALTHPDLEIVSRPPEKNLIPIDLLIGDREHRMREGLCHRISLKSFSGGRKIAIIDDADFLNQEGANCLLKTLEEPPRGSIIILIGTSEQRQLPTIRSRCQIVRFNPLNSEQISTLLISHDLIEDHAQALNLASIVHGSLTAAVNLADSSIQEFREIFLMQLATLDPARNGFLKELTSFVDAAGKDASARRDRMRMISDWAILFYRNLMCHVTGTETVNDDPIIVRGLSVALKQNQAETDAFAESTADCIQRSLETQHHIVANANQATLLESWLCDLGKISRNQYVGIFE